MQTQPILFRNNQIADPIVDCSGIIFYHFHVPFILCFVPVCLVVVMVTFVICCNEVHSSGKKEMGTGRDLTKL